MMNQMNMISKEKLMTILSKIDQQANDTVHQSIGKKELIKVLKSIVEEGNLDIEKEEQSEEGTKNEIQEKIG